MSSVLLSRSETFRFLSTHGSEPLRIPPDRELSGQGFADQKETQDKFYFDPGVPDLAALDPDGNWWVCAEELGDSPGETSPMLDHPAAPRSAVPRTHHAHPSAYSRSSAHASSQSSPTPPPDRDVGELMNASGLEDIPVPKLLDGGCPKELPQQRGSACHS